MRTQDEMEGRQFDWMPESWWCGTPDQRCQFCGLPLLFAPAFLSIQSCQCNSTQDSNVFQRPSRKVAVKFMRKAYFVVRVNNPAQPARRSIPIPTAVGTERQIKHQRAVKNR